MTAVAADQRQQLLVQQVGLRGRAGGVGGSLSFLMKHERLQG